MPARSAPVSTLAPRWRARIAPVGLLLVLAHGALADTGPEHVLVTASRLNGAAADPTEIIDRRAIEELNPASTTALLRRVPGVIVSENGGAAGQSFISIRGGEPNFTLVLIDGIAVNDPTNSRGGGFDYNQLDPAAIERVEVYRGGISAIHGGEAISGVIHFITRRAAGSEMALEAGNDRQRRASATIAGPITPSVDGLVTLSSNEQARSALSRYQNRQVLGRLAFNSARVDSTLMLSLSQQDLTALPEDSGGNRFASLKLAERRDGRQLLAGLNGEYRASDTLSWVAKASVSEHQEDAEHPGIADGALGGIPPSAIRSDYRRGELEVFARARLPDAWTGLVGANYRNARGSNKGFLDYGFPVPVDFRLEQEAWAVFAEASGRWRAFSADLGLRLDAPDGFQRETSVRAALNYQVTPSVAAHMSYGEGYKLPSFFALAHPLVGNPNLAPERSGNAELGLRYQRTDGGTVKITYFHNEFTDLVDFDPVAFRSVNRSSVLARGAEFSTYQPLTYWLSAGVDVQYLDTDIRDSDARLRRRPRWSGGLQLKASYEAVDLRLSTDSRGSFTDSSVATGARVLPGYTTIDLAANWRLRPGLTLTLNVDNLLNADMEEAIGFDDTGRQWRVGFRYGF